MTSRFKAGISEVDITPPVGLPMWGYAARAGLSQGVLDSLYARVLVLEAGENRLAVVAVDLGRPFGRASLDRLRTIVKNSSGISCALVSASHTHSGPVIRDEYPSDDVPEWERRTVKKIADAIGRAYGSRVEAWVGMGYGVASIGHNRRRVNPDGTVTWLERNVTRIPTSPVDSTVSVLRVDSADRSPLAILINFACHPVIFGADNLEYSADFPGAVARTIRESFDSKPLCLFLQGAAGDINPYHAVTPLKEDARRSCDQAGTELGQEAVRVARNIHTDTSEEGRLDSVEDSLTFDLRWDPGKFRAALETFGKQFLENSAPRIRSKWELPVSTVLINRRIALMAMPGEPFVEFQISWRDRCPLRDCMLLGYTNGYFGYFPTIRAATEGGYGAVGATTWVEVGAGERIIDHALIRTYEMLGRLGDEPRVTEW